jgi:hypothetical protein
VARLKANAIPIAIVRIIDCFLIVELIAPSHRIGKPARVRKLSSNMTKTMTEQRAKPFMLLNGPLDALQNAPRVKGKPVTRIANSAIGPPRLPHLPALAIVAPNCPIQTRTRPIR